MEGRRSVSISTPRGIAFRVTLNHSCSVEHYTDNCLLDVPDGLGTLEVLKPYGILASLLFVLLFDPPGLPRSFSSSAVATVRLMHLANDGWRRGSSISFSGRCRSRHKGRVWNVERRARNLHAADPKVDRIKGKKPEMNEHKRRESQGGFSACSRVFDPRRYEVIISPLAATILAGSWIGSPVDDFDIVKDLTCGSKVNSWTRSVTKERQRRRSTSPISIRLSCLELCYRIDRLPVSQESIPNSKRDTDPAQVGMIDPVVCVKVEQPVLAVY